MKNLDNIVLDGFLTKFKSSFKGLARALTIASALYLGACGSNPGTTDGGDAGNGDSDITYISDIATGSVTPNLGGSHEYEVGEDIVTSFDVPAGTEECSAELKKDSDGVTFVVGPEACDPGTTYTATIPTDGLAAGGYDVTLTALNPDDSKSVTIDDVTLTETQNQAPIINRIHLTSSNIGSNIGGGLFAHDPEGENLDGNWSINSDYPGAAVGPSGELAATTTPGISELGNVYTFTPEVCDSQGACANTTFEARIDPYDTQAILVYGSGSNVVFRMPNLIADKFAQHIPGCPTPLADDTDGSADSGATPYEANITADLASIMAEWTNMSATDKETFCMYNNNCETISNTLDQVASEGNAVAYQLNVRWHGD